VSHEILYTSAPQGLKPGSRGFCTVVSTAGIAKNLAERLESFSGYRHAFMAHEAQADQNPVNHAHYHTTVGGRKYHVLSRIADAGLDYTQRSNKLAHHVALEPDEVANAPGGPAWVMAAEGFFVKQWDGQVRTLPAGRKPTGSDRPAQLCQSWKRLTGDAGWGGVLAESALRKGGVMSVIFPAGTPVLDLVVESLGLLPPEKRWEVTFSTYFTKAPAGVDCQWRFLLDGTPEATALRRDVRAAVIDLCKPLGQAQGGDLVQAARARPVSGRGPSRSEAPLQRSTPDVSRSVATTAQPRAEESGELSLAPPPPPSPARRTVPPPAWLPSAAPRRSRRWLVPIVVAGLLLIALGAVLGVVLSRPRDVPPVQVASPRPTPPPKPEPSKPLDAPAPPEPAPQEQATQAPDGTKPKPSPSLDGPKLEEKPSVKEEKKPEPKPDPFADIRKRQNKLRLPPLMVTEGPSFTFSKRTLNKAPATLALLTVKDGAACKLELEGSEWKSHDKQENRIEEPAGGDFHGKRRWEVITQGTTSLDQADPPRKIAAFVLDGESLTFNWETDRPTLRLGFCRVKLTVDGVSQVCEFDISKQVPSVPLRSDDRIRLVDAEEYLLRRDDKLVVDVRFPRIPGAMFSRTPQRLTAEEHEITLFFPASSGGPRPAAATVSVELSLNGLDRDSGQVAGPSLKGRLMADACMLKRQPGPSGELGVPLQTWQRTTSRMELTDEEIQIHRKKADEDFGKFKVYVDKSGFGKVGDWLKETSEKRAEAVAFAPKWTEYQQLLRYGAADNEESKKRRDALEKEVHDWPGSESLIALTNTHGLNQPQNLHLARQLNLVADFVEEVNAWCDAIKNLKGKLQTDGQLDYRLSVKVDDREIELVRTEGFSDAKPAGDAKK